MRISARCWSAVKKPAAGFPARGQTPMVKWPVTAFLWAPLRSVPPVPNTLVVRSAAEVSSAAVAVFVSVD